MNSSLRKFDWQSHFVFSFVLCGTVSLFAAAYFARYLLVFTLIGVGLGVILSPLLTWIHEKVKIPRTLAILILLLVYLTGVLFFVYLLGVILADQFRDLFENLPNHIATFKSWWQKNVSGFPQLAESIREIEVSTIAQAIGARVFHGIGSGVGALSGVVYAIVLSLFTAVRAQPYFESLIQIFPEAYQDMCARKLRLSASAIRQWFAAQLIDMVIVGILTSVGLWIVDVQYWAVFGILTGALAIIPYLGVFSVICFASLVIFSTSPEKLPWVLVVFAVTQQLEGNLILPLVMRQRAALPEVPLLVFMLVMGLWFGLLGVFIAPPTLAILIRLWQSK